MFTFARGSAVLSLVLLLALTGCTPTASNADETTPTPRTTSSLTPTPTPSASGTGTTSDDGAQPALSSLLLSPAGLGPILVGEPVPATGTAGLTTRWDATYCDHADADPATDTGVWRPNYPDGPSSLSDRGPFDILGVDVVGAINVWSPEISTAEGIHVGSTRDELVAAYPGFDDTIDHAGLSTLYVVDGPSGRIMFEVAGSSETRDVADEYWGDQQNTVVWMQVIAAEYEVHGFAGNDFGGPCPV